MDSYPYRDLGFFVHHPVALATGFSAILFTMTLDALMMLMGVLTIVLPYLGFPSAWDRPFYTFFGILFIILGITVRRRGSATHTPPSPKNPFVDSQPTRDATPSVHEET